MKHKKQKIIDILKNTYSQDVRQQVVQSIHHEENESEIPEYKIINQIFSYVLKELHWNIAQSTEVWDTVPLDIMIESFPDIEQTKWFQEKKLMTKKIIKTEIKA